MISRRLAAAVLAAFLLLAVATCQQAVAAQLACGPFRQVIEQIRKKFGERVQATGINRKGHAVFILANPASGTFTYLTVRPTTGLTCIGDDGRAFDSIWPRKSLNTY